jgi:hypothetical protein
MDILDFDLGKNPKKTVHLIVLNLLSNAYV